MNGVPAASLLLAARFVAALGVLAVGPELAWHTLQDAGLLPAAPSLAQNIEGRMLVFVLACGVVVAFAAWQPPGVPWRPARPGLVLGRYVPFAVLWLVLVLGYLAAARALGIDVLAQRPLEYLAHGDRTRAGWWVVAAAPVLGAPLAEEIVFRGYLQQALLGVMRPAWAIAIAAAGFGMVHTLPYALPVGALGAFFGWLVHRTGSLWPAVIAHAVHNGLTVTVVVLWPESLNLLFPR